jgi:hypothetical protein
MGLYSVSEGCEKFLLFVDPLDNDEEVLTPDISWVYASLRVGPSFRDEDGVLRVRFAPANPTDTQIWVGQ